MSEPEAPADATAPQEAQPEPLSFSVGVDLEANVVVMKLTQAVDTIVLDAQGARLLVEHVMRAGKRLAAHNAPRILMPAASSYVKRVTPASVNGSLLP